MATPMNVAHVNGACAVVLVDENDPHNLIVVSDTAALFAVSFSGPTTWVLGTADMCLATSRQFVGAVSVSPSQRHALVSGHNIFARTVKYGGMYIMSYCAARCAPSIIEMAPPCLAAELTHLTAIKDAVITDDMIVYILIDSRILELTRSSIRCVYNSGIVRLHSHLVVCNRRAAVEPENSDCLAVVDVRRSTVQVYAYAGGHIPYRESPRDIYFNGSTVVRVSTTVARVPTYRHCWVHAAYRLHDGHAEYMGCYTNDYYKLGRFTPDGDRYVIADNTGVVIMESRTWKQLTVLRIDPAAPLYSSYEPVFAVASVLPHVILYSSHSGEPTTRSDIYQMQAPAGPVILTVLTEARRRNRFTLPTELWKIIFDMT